jgi:predicted unusual protein kinase regulating ubiquinone biosynthesis (AarF/ABC1/UbiB family)
MADEALRRIDALIQVGMRLTRSAPSGRILLARIAERIDPDWIPRPWGDTIASELKAASAASREPIDPAQVDRALRHAWGAAPADELDEFELEPVAITPSSQVHRGVLDGTPVAIKLLRPGLAASVRQDLLLLESLLAPLGAAFPAADPSAAMTEIRERVLDELDLEHEATVQRRFHRSLRNHPLITVPAPITRLAREDVLVSQWVDGVPLRDAPDIDDAAARLVLFVLGAARSGVFHCDPHPNDVLVMADGRVAIIDFGATRTVERSRVDASARALEAFCEQDTDAFGEALEQLGWLPAGQAGTARSLAEHALGELAGPEGVRLDSETVIAARDRLFGRPAELVHLLQAGALAPEDLWPARGVAQLFGTIARAGATGRWRELARAAVRDGWSAQANAV